MMGYYGGYGNYGFGGTMAAVSGVFGFILILGFMLFLNVIGRIMLMRKFKQPAWMGLAPGFICNFVIMDYIEGNGWFGLLSIFFPINFVCAYRMGKAFGKSTFWIVVFLFILSPIGYLILALGSAKPGKNHSLGFGGSLSKLVADGVIMSRTANATGKTGSGSGVCPVCGRRNDADSIFCEECGSRL